MTYSHAMLGALTAEPGLEYDGVRRGIRKIYTDERDFAVAVTPARREPAAARAFKARDECIAIEPALAEGRLAIHGGIHMPRDESGETLTSSRWTSPP